MLCGLLPPTSGHLSVAGYNLRTTNAQARRIIGYVAQKFSLYGTLTVRENLEFFGGIYGLSKQEIKQRIQEVLAQFSLEDKEDTVAATLPLGYKQRLSMAAALLQKPAILFLDDRPVVSIRQRDAAYWHRLPIWPIEEPRLLLRRTSWKKRSTATAL